MRLIIYTYFALSASPVFLFILGDDSINQPVGSSSESRQLLVETDPITGERSIAQKGRYIISYPEGVLDLHYNADKNGYRAGYTYVSPSRASTHEEKPTVIPGYDYQEPSSPFRDIQPPIIG